MLHRRVEYVVSCDARAVGCVEGDIIPTASRKEANVDAFARGWRPAGRGRWLCPNCAKKAEEAAAKKAAKG